MTPFYTITEGTIKVPLLKVEEFLQDSGYHLYVVSPESTIFVKVEDNKVTEVPATDIYRYIMDQAKKCELENEDDREELVDKVSTSRYRIISNLSTILQPIELNFIEDTQEMSYIFYKNVVVTITKDVIETKGYNELTGNVWKNQILDREYTGELPPATYNELENSFYKFLWAINPSFDLDSLMSIIGYLLHRYKRRDFAKAVVFYDANIDMPDPCGATGKTLLSLSLGKIRRLIQEDGKMNDLSSRFALSRVTIVSELFLMDDVTHNYPFDKLFPLITGDFVVEKKNQNRFSIPFEMTPKLIITSNYCVIKEGDSYTRRVIEFVLDNTFNLECTPVKAYGHVFFTDWDAVQWHEFDNTMILAIKFYLNNGVIEQEDGRKYYQLQNQTSDEFMTFAGSFQTQVSYEKRTKLQEFLENNPRHVRIESNTFTKWMKLYAQYKNWKTKESHSGDINYIQFFEDEEPEEEATDQTKAD
jgi:hypothetical protein